MPPAVSVVELVSVIRVPAATLLPAVEVHELPALDAVLHAMMVLPGVQDPEELEPVTETRDQVSGTPT